MKVLKPSDLNNTVWKKVVTCTGAGNNQNGCGALLEINLTDIFLTGGGPDMSGVGEDYDYTIKCPDCGALTDLPQNTRFPDHGTFPTYETYQRRLKRAAAKSDGGGPDA